MINCALQQSMVHFTIYGNLLTSVVICRGIPWKSVQKFADHLWQARGIVFWDLRNRLLEICEIVFQAPADSSYGTEINLWEYVKSSSGSLISFATHAVNMHN